MDENFVVRRVQSRVRFHDEAVAAAAAVDVPPPCSERGATKRCSRTSLSRTTREVVALGDRLAAWEDDVHTVRQEMDQLKIYLDNLTRLMVDTKNDSS